MSDEYEFCDCGHKHVDHAKFGDGECDYCDCKYFIEDRSIVRVQ